MFKSYLIIGYRNLRKSRIFSAINILGLAIGMAACFFIFLYVNFERSYDRNNKNGDNLYRVNISYSGSFSEEKSSAANHPAVGPAMKAEFPEVATFARATNTSLFGGASVVSYTNSQGNTSIFNEDRIFMVDPSFLQMFTIPFTAGNPANALSQKGNIVLSQSSATRLFGKENPMGKTLHVNKQFPLKVTGVFQDIPDNSHIKYNMLISLAIMDGVQDDNWTWPEFYNYVLLAPGTDPKKVEAKFPAMINKHLGAVMKQYGFGCQFHLQKITDIHLGESLKKEPEANGDPKNIYFLSIIGALILVIAWINYVNLSTAKSMERAKEVGLRKVSGATKIQLIVQFISESFLINLLAIVIAALAVVAFFPLFSGFVGKQISEEFLSSGLLHQPGFWLIVIALFVTGAFIVGAYPAFVLIGYQPAIVLKGKFSQSLKGIFLRKALVAFQFVLSILLIAGTITVYKQLAYMRNHDLGYNKDQLLVVKAPVATDSTFGSKLTAFKNELSKNPSISGISGSADIPGKLIVNLNLMRKENEDKKQNVATYILAADENYLPTFNVPLTAGRNFNRSDTANYFKTTKDAKIMVNEEVVKQLGFKNNEEAINKRVDFSFISDDHRGEIVGVVKNYHQRSLREGYDPIIYLYPNNNYWTYLSIHINSNKLTENLASIERSYKSIFTGNPFEYFFLDDFFNRQYEADQRFGKVFGLFTILALFVACLGLLGLSTFLSRLRIKEIGIRKVLGASVYSILVLFSVDFIKLVLLASLIAIPLFYFVSNLWLQNYAFHISLNWIILIIPSVVLLIISLATISIQSIKAAMANPVASIHTE